MHIIGERMSKITDLDSISQANNDLYESYEAVLQNKPLDTGRLLYAKLRFALPDDVKVEVIWNHFDNSITALIWRDDFERQLIIKDEQMARSEKIIYINSIVEGALEMVCQ
jgi:hypothetical protein